jgi:hypothetical protein
MREGLDILSNQMIQENPYLLGARMQYRQFLLDAHRKEEAKQVDDQIALSMKHAPPLCKDCVVNAMSLANSWR